MFHRAEERIDLRQRFDLVAEKLDAVGRLVVGREDLDDVAADAKGSTPEVDIVAFVKNLNEAPGNVFAADVLPLLEQGATCRSRPPAIPGRRCSSPS